MANRPEVATAPAPIAVVDTVLLGQQIAAALIRVPFRNPLQGHSSAITSLGVSATREIVRAFMGYASSLPIDEFRSIEQMLDGVCTAVMPPVVAAYGVQASRAEFGGVPGVLYLPPGRIRARPPRRRGRGDARSRLGVLTQSEPAHAMIDACSSAARRCTSASRYHGSEIIVRNAARLGYQTVSTSS